MKVIILSVFLGGVSRGAFTLKSHFFIKSRGSFISGIIIQRYPLHMQEHKAILQKLSHKLFSESDFPVCLPRDIKFCNIKGVTLRVHPADTDSSDRLLYLLFHYGELQFRRVLFI